MKKGLLPGIGLIVVLLAAGIWANRNFERVTERVEVGFQGEARRNPLLAVTRLYQRMGVPVRESGARLDLRALPPGAAVILGDHRVGISPRRVREFLDWVDAGGHLMVEAEISRDKDLLLDELRVSRKQIQVRARVPPSEVQLPHAPQALRVYFGPWQRLSVSDAAASRFDDANGTYLVHLKRGRGAVTVLTSLDFMTNSEIAKNDHAEFAWELVRFAPQAREVVMVPWYETPSLMTWLLENAGGMLAVAAMLLLVWLWHIAPRFGPLAPEPLPVRRRLLDHLRASGRFQWQRRSSAQLLKAAREACLRKIAHSHPVLAGLPRTEHVEKLAALTDIGAGQIDLALYRDAADALQFTHAVSALQRIEDRLRRNPGLTRE